MTLPELRRRVLCWLGWHRWIPYGSVIGPSLIVCIDCHRVDAEASVTVPELRRTIAAMRDDARDKVRVYALMLGVDDAFTTALTDALGDISLDEALDALERKARVPVRQGQGSGRRNLSKGVT
jgi:hypothetical protein